MLAISNQTGSIIDELPSLAVADLVWQTVKSKSVSGAVSSTPLTVILVLASEPCFQKPVLAWLPLFGLSNSFKV